MTARIALGTVLLGAGVLWLLSSFDAIDLSYRTWIALILIGIGLAIVLTPGHHGFLVFLGVVVVLAGVPALVVDEDVFEGGIGDSVETPTASADIEPYHHGIGKLTIDLTSTALAGDTAVEASLGIGELVVRVPRSADVSVDAHAGMGNIELLGDSEGGIDVDLDRTFKGPSEKTLGLDLEVGIGNIRIERAGP
jgi:predicted membrane protein